MASRLTGSPGEASCRVWRGEDPGGEAGREGPPLRGAARLAGEIARGGEGREGRGRGVVRRERRGESRRRIGRTAGRRTRRGVAGGGSAPRRAGKGEAPGARAWCDVELESG